MATRFNIESDGIRGLTDSDLEDRGWPDKNRPPPAPPQPLTCWEDQMVEQVCPNCGKPLPPSAPACVYCGHLVSLPEIILKPGTSLRGRYEIQQLIHTGGMSYIYLVKDKLLFERLCVAKEIREQLRSEQHQRKLEEEALRMARLNHPGIAMILDHFVEQDHYFLIEEYVRGKSLSEVSRERRSSLKEDEVVGWAISICDVLAYIHSQGIVHRDISPDNIMLTDDGIIKFIDFGTLRELRSMAAGQTAGMGKYGYTPPEQWQGQWRPESDIFALGATVYQLLTGFLPLSKSYLTGQGPQKEDFYPLFPSIRSRNTAVSPQLEIILLNALQIDIEKRFRSVTEMRESLIRVKDTANFVPVSPVTVPITSGNAGVVRPATSSAVSVASGNSVNKGVGLETNANKQVQHGNVRLSEENIKRKAVSDTLQHPSTLLPAAVCVMSAGYLLLLSPMFGGGVAAIAIIGISGVTAAASFVSRYPTEYRKNTQQFTEITDAERAQSEEFELEKLRETIQSGFFSLHSQQGTRALEELFSERQQLMAALAQQRITDPLSISVIQGLAEETYKRGLSVLSDTLELLNVIQTPGRGRLEKEIAELENDVAFLKGRPDEAERVVLKQEMLNSFKERLGALAKLELHCDQLIYQAQRCEGSLHSTRIELATSRAGSSKSGVDSVVAALQERIQQVREVQEEINRLGY